jgi:tellurite resistance protein TerC
LLAASQEDFVSIDVPVWAWFALVAVLALMLAIDLIRHREAHAPSTKEALIESIVWVSCGLVFGGVIAATFGGAAFGEYISGYLIEKSLSIDNVFVWSILFTTMAIPVKYQHRVLFWGIFGALAMRAGFIVLGSALIEKFWWVLLIFGVFLIYSGVKIIRHRDDEGDHSSNFGVNLLKRVMPVSDELDGQKFFTVRNGVRVATPLLAALVVIELTDVVFAVDSVPAILAVSREPFLVFSANAFAILGLRAMYFLLADAKERFHYLSHALGAILVFVGIKMTISHWYHMNTFVSLAVILSMLALAIIFSIRKAKEAGADSKETHAAHH